MKGDHQHYIPQHVQRGFKAPGKGRLAKVWLYHCDRPARREATLNVGAQNRFYSSPRLDGVETLDEALTRYENGRLQILLNTLRALEGGSDVEADLAAEVITHLVYRNAHARELLRFGARRLALAASEVFTDEGRVRRMLGLDVARLNPRFAAHLKGGFGRQSLPPNLPLDDDTLGEIAFAFGREKFPDIWAKARSEAIGMTLAGLEMIEGGGIRDLHADILGEGPVAPGMANQLVGLRWTVVPSDQIVALPDCIAVAFGDAPLPEPLMASQSASRRAVVMPLTSHCLLVGLQPGADSPDFSLWNLWAAACSATFFIASHQDPELDDYRRYIGGRAFGELERVIESAVADLDQGPTPRAAGGAPLLGPSSRDPDQQDPVAPPSLIPLTLKGFGDEAIAQGLGAAIRDLLVEVDGGVPINRLDGITFASDFGEALATLDRGLNAAPQTVRNLEYGTTMAMSPAVLRDGVVMGHVVCDARIGQSLLCDDPDLRRMTTTPARERD
ncbi:hypothetical protein HMPREF0185_00949 [Brevundimonas diminuta 470-4]|nr:hypothetical protein HMPREF0185_00949 [Brevundimonas diminuta 470-4]